MWLSFCFVPYLVSPLEPQTTPWGSLETMLTKKQHELLLFIHGHLQRHGVSPSFDEMKDALALKSKSGIHRLITGLEERGFIKRLPHRARAVEIARLPDDLGADAPRGQPSGGTKLGFAPKVIQGDFSASMPGVLPRAPLKLDVPADGSGVDQLPPLRRTNKPPPS